MSFYLISKNLLLNCLPCDLSLEIIFVILGTNWSTFVKIMLVLNLIPSKGRSFSNLGLLAYVVKCIIHNITGDQFYVAYFSLAGSA